ncbi:molybdopterin-dependent oxidoreductase [Labilibaculum sp. K2S]|uniref:molybdopterin-containing oxidoreductase family protein n=1 Tax=Labilibaculum sp. K2S TaxID=3056386 RepID=UPI0025A4795F|nr:molybdopterin-dependent oxidoreductase [Labilibaculum sp. K2S]MDM8159813.1 molybdopterin-dependent oxidoreductase [Labilibaculum sp. K2S]
MKSRRQFLKISSLSAAGLVFGGGLLETFADNLLKNNQSYFKGPYDFARTPTYCEVCFWKCAGWVHKDENGKIKKIIGNDDDPNCNGRFCPRGTGGVGMYFDKDRLQTPLIRTDERGKQTFREATWDEAFDYIASKMNKIKEEHGPECTALFTHGSGGKYFGNLLKGFGSNNIAAPSYAQCRGPREVAFIATYGQGVDSPENTDIRDTKCLVLIGSHIGENMHNGQVQEMSDAIDKGAVIITVDPRFSTAASKSKHWLPIKPSTDIALLLSWINVIINEELYDKKYVEKYTFGFDQLKKHVQAYTPEWAYGITTIKPQQIRETAHEMANAAPAVIVHPGRHVTWYGDDTQRIRAVAILNALLGSWGRRGGFYSPEKASVPHYHLPDFPKPNKNWRDAMGGKYKLADLALASGVCQATIPSPEMSCSIKGWIVNGTNLINTLPDQKKTIAAIQALDLLVVVDTMPMEITGYADVVLPECTYLERYDSLRISQGRIPSIALRMPAVDPLYNTKPAFWMARELAKKLDLLQYFPFETIEEEIDWELKQVGSSLEEMQRIGVKLLDREADDLYFGEDEDVEFNTNTGKIELYSTALEEEGFDPFPVFTQHPEPSEGFYRLIYGRAPMHTFSRTANNPNLTDLMDENSVWVNPKVAKVWDLKNDQYVYLENQDGVISDFKIKVRITERIRWDSVYMVHGFGHADKRMTRAFGKGVSDTQMITNVMIDPIMGGTGMRGNFVTFRFDNKKAEV